MNKEIMKQAGFTEQVKDFENNKCPFCKESININNFNDPLSVKEYHISGLCQKCQDKVFGKTPSVIGKCLFCGNYICENGYCKEFCSEKCEKDYLDYLYSK